jgi:uncharacterized protein (DUF2147 family)
MFHPVARRGIRTRHLLLSCACLVFASAIPAAPAGNAKAIGIWRTADKNALIEMFPCAEELCGRIVWIKDPLGADGQPLRDDRNPDPALRTRPRCGLQIIEGLRPNDASGWEAGEVYDAWEGKRYRLRAELHGDSQLKLRGYLGIPALGATLLWDRMPADGPRCASAN